MLSKILAILAAIAKLFLLWDKESNERQGAQKLAIKIKKAQDEKIEAANNIPDSNLTDELLLKPADRDQK